MYFTLMAGKFLFAAYGTDHFKTENLLNEAKFEITSAKEETEAGESVMKIRYISISKQNGRPKSEGSAEFLLNRGWVLRRHIFNTIASFGTGPNATLKKLHVEMTAEYGDDRGGIPVPKRVQYVEPEGSERKIETFVFDKIDLGTKTPANEFTLAYYKLPDVLAPPADPARSYASYWIFGLSILALVAALLLRRRGQ